MNGLGTSGGNDDVERLVTWSRNFPQNADNQGSRDDCASADRYQRRNNGGSRGFLQVIILNLFLMVVVAASL